MPKKKRATKKPTRDLANETAALLAQSSFNAPPAPPTEVKIAAGGGGALDCYGKSDPEYKQMLREKFVMSEETTAPLLQWFLMFNDPTVRDILEHTKNWTIEQFRQRCLELCDVEDLALQLITPSFWTDTVDNTRDTQLLRQGHDMVTAEKLQDAFQHFMEALQGKQNSVELWLASAKVLLMTGQLKDAVVHLLEAVRRMRNCDSRKVRETRVQRTLPHSLY
jgi:predicted Zn-dependent protease